MQFKLRYEPAESSAAVSLAARTSKPLFKLTSVHRFPRQYRELSFAPTFRAKNKNIDRYHAIAIFYRRIQYKFRIDFAPYNFILMSAVPPRRRVVLASIRKYFSPIWKNFLESVHYNLKEELGIKMTRNSSDLRFTPRSSRNLKSRFVN